MNQPLHNSLRLRLIMGSAVGVILAVLLAGRRLVAFETELATA